MGPLDLSETVPGVPDEIADAAVKSVNRNRMLDYGKTTCKRIHPEPVIEKERSHSSEERHADLLVGTWYCLIPDPSGALVSEVVDSKDLAHQSTHTPGHHFTPTEWKAIVDSGSVKVLDSEVANTIRKERPDRVINSRMVRRLKPQEGTFQKPKAKSRWCVLGHLRTHSTDREHHDVPFSVAAV